MTQTKRPRRKSRLLLRLQRLRPPLHLCAPAPLRLWLSLSRPCAPMTTQPKHLHRVHRRCHALFRSDLAVSCVRDPAISKHPFRQHRHAALYRQSQAPKWRTKHHCSI
jgi:hypothetical protein